MCQVQQQSQASGLSFFFFFLRLSGEAAEVVRKAEYAKMGRHLTRKKSGDQTTNHRMMLARLETSYGT